MLHYTGKRRGLQVPIWCLQAENRQIRWFSHTCASRQKWAFTAFWNPEKGCPFPPEGQREHENGGRSPPLTWISPFLLGTHGTVFDPRTSYSLFTIILRRPDSKNPPFPMRRADSHLWKSPALAVWPWL